MRYFEYCEDCDQELKCSACSRSEPDRFNDRVGHVGYAIIILGVLLIAHKVIWGWACYVVGDLIWMYLGWRMRMSSIYIWQAIFTVLAVYGYWSWL